MLSPAPTPAPAQPAHILLARAVSIVGHPMVLVPAAIAVAMRGRVTSGQATLVLGAMFGAIAIVAVYLVHGVRSGRLSHVDVPAQRERGGFYRVALAASAAATVVLAIVPAPPAAPAGFGCAFALLAVASVVNRWVKASLHTAFAIVAAGVVGPEAPRAFACLAVMAVLVPWSRVTLGRHTKREVVVGAALGVTTALALALVRPA